VEQQSEKVLMKH